MHRSAAHDTAVWPWPHRPCAVRVCVILGQREQRSRCCSFFFSFFLQENNNIHVICMWSKNDNITKTFNQYCEFFLVKRSVNVISLQQDGHIDHSTCNRFLRHRRAVVMPGWFQPVNNYYLCLMFRQLAWLFPMPPELNVITLLHFNEKSPISEHCLANPWSGEARFNLRSYF